MNNKHILTNEKLNIICIDCLIIRRHIPSCQVFCFATTRPDCFLLGQPSSILLGAGAHKLRLVLGINPDSGELGLFKTEVQGFTQLGLGSSAEMTLLGSDAQVEVFFRNSKNSMVSGLKLKLSVLQTKVPQGM